MQHLPRIVLTEVASELKAFKHRILDDLNFPVVDIDCAVGQFFYAVVCKKTLRQSVMAVCDSVAFDDLLIENNTLEQYQKERLFSASMDFCEGIYLKLEALKAYSRENYFPYVFKELRHDGTVVLIRDDDA